ncbi:MAG: G/U mismatch-specific DNA glycosylase [Herpetosiphonaceae bacterium]|nr:G/U mismatch-specific DNA glycosylase [Herpetosiphonaceae bacterium]
MKMHKPTQAELLAAAGKVVQDVIAADLRVLFCGINPGLYTAAVGHHFARPGNRFWPTLYAAGFTDRLLAPSEERQLLLRGLGITNIAARASARADELSPQELEVGGQQLVAKINHYHPRYLAVLGISAYRTAFGRPRAVLGRQPEELGATVVWVLPNPSGLNAHYQANDLTRLFGELRIAVEAA